MKIATTTLATLFATPALADPGHFIASHGHSHWIAAAALALAAVIGAVAFWTCLLYTSPSPRDRS